MALMEQQNRDEYGRVFDGIGEKISLVLFSTFLFRTRRKKIKTNSEKLCTRLVLQRLERSYQTIFQVSFIINNEKQTRLRIFFRSLRRCPSPKNAPANVLLLDECRVTFILRKMFVFSGVKFSKITLEMVFEF